MEIDNFDSMKITIYDTTEGDRGVIIVFKIQIDDVSKQFNSYLTSNNLI